MRIAELLADGAVVVPLPGATLQEAAGHLFGRLAELGSIDPEEAGRLGEQVARDPETRWVRLTEQAMLLYRRVQSTAALAGALGITTEPMEIPGDAEPGETRILVVLAFPPGPVANVNVQMVPALRSALREASVADRLLGSSDADEVLTTKALMNTDLHDRLLVEDGLTPLKYRIYPDTPITEVMDLMVRRGLHSVPVVGENLEVLGLISAADVLKHVLPSRGPRRDAETTEGSSGPVTAREVMTRAVMCVSEDQGLLEAAKLMVNRDVDQLPVVREGELIGFLTRETVLRALSEDIGSGPMSSEAVLRALSEDIGTDPDRSGPNPNTQH